jgi:hypothetical protein
MESHSEQCAGKRAIDNKHHRKRFASGGNREMDWPTGQADPDERCDAKEEKALGDRTLDVGEGREPTGMRRAPTMAAIEQMTDSSTRERNHAGHVVLCSHEFGDAHGNAVCVTAEGRLSVVEKKEAERGG